MLDGVYRKRLADDLPRWRDAGWVTAEGSDAILASLAGQRSTIGLAAIVGVLGALLLGLGVIAFVGANWDYMPRIVRFGMLVATMGAAYGAAAMLAARDMRMFAEAALLVAGLVFAAAIALVGQTYHLAGEFSDAVLLWEVGIVGAALLTRSATLTVLALAGAGYWTWLNVTDLGIIPHWGSLLLIVIVSAIAVGFGERYTRLLAVLTLAFWIVVNLIGVAARLDWSPFQMLAVGAALSLLFWSIGSVFATMRSRPQLAALGYAMLWPGIAAVLLSVGLLQLALDTNNDLTSELWFILVGAFMVAVASLVALSRLRGGISMVDAIGAVAIGVAAVTYVSFVFEDSMVARLAGGAMVLGTVLWAINQGQTGPQRVGKTTGLVAFGVEIIYLYVVTLGSLMDTALAFLVGGVLFIGLAYGLYRIDRRLARKPGLAAEPAP